MKALTIWQPWASLIIGGVKPYEFRSWPAPRAIRGDRIAIHAGARPVRKSEIADLILRLRSTEAWSTCLRMPEALPLLEEWHTNPSRLPLSSIVGTAILGVPIRSHEIVGEFGGVINDSDRDDHCNWAWPLISVQSATPIVPAKGAQGFWNWAAPREMMVQP